MTCVTGEKGKGRIEFSKRSTIFYSYLLSIINYSLSSLFSISIYSLSISIIYHYLLSISIYIYLYSITNIIHYALNRIFMHMIQITNHLFWDDFSLLSIHPLPRFPYPHACLLLTHAQSSVNMQCLPRMTFVSFPIAHSPPSCQPPSPCLLRHTPPPQERYARRSIPTHVLRHTTYPSATRNFSFPPPTQPTHLRD
nr:MAG TPA: hypothetical protein [Caudoviricetes sp.]